MNFFRHPRVFFHGAVLTCCFLFRSVVEFASKYSFKIDLPKLFVEGKYIVDGKILVLPVKGSGLFTGNFTGGSGEIRIRGGPKEINGETHFIVNKIDIKMTVKKGRIDLGPLFQGDRTLANIINETINQNFELFSKELIPLIEKSLARIIKGTANKILERFSMAQLFPL